MPGGHVRATTGLIAVHFGFSQAVHISTFQNGGQPLLNALSQSQMHGGLAVGLTMEPGCGVCMASFAVVGRQFFQPW